LGENDHSNAIAALLSTSVSGGLAAAFLQEIFACLSEAPVEPSYQFAYREVRLDELDAALCGKPLGERRLDVLVKTRDVVFVIENKVWAAESTDQTQDYAEVLARRFPSHRRVHVLLSPHGQVPRSPAFGAITYRTLFDSLERARVGDWPQSVAHLADEYLACLWSVFVEPVDRALRQSADRLKGRGYELD
jgi:hypothetical protein